jgi:hypothetical protein
MFNVTVLEIELFKFFFKYNSFKMEFERVSQKHFLIRPFKNF